jgi:hypothetical protein
MLINPSHETERSQLVTVVAVTNVLLERRWINRDAPPVLTFHLAEEGSAETLGGAPVRGFEPVGTPWDQLTDFFQCVLCLAAGR